MHVVEGITLELFGIERMNLKSEEYELLFYKIGQFIEKNTIVLNIRADAFYTVNSHQRGDLKVRVPLKMDSL